MKNKTIFDEVQLQNSKNSQSQNTDKSRHYNFKYLFNSVDTNFLPI